jgi:hypothetical protein
MSNVSVLPGCAPPVTGEAIPEVVEALEWYLEKARRGEITAIALAAVLPNGTPVPQVSTSFKRAAGTAYALETAINRLKRRFEHYLDEE